MSDEELRNKCALKISSPYAVLHAFLKDGHYNHSPQFHPIEVGCFFLECGELSPLLPAAAWRRISAN
jgi:hypothetical protein